MSVWTPTTGSAGGLFALPPIPIRRWSVDEYHEMLRAGILTENDPIELLDGWLVAKMTKNPPHRIATRRVRKALERVTPEGWYVDSQEPITLSASEPEPDGAVIRGDSADYADRHPPGDAVALVVEVADATLEFDRTMKKAIYAQAGIPAYWIVNLIDRRVEVYSSPTGAADCPEYRDRSDYLSGEDVPLFVEDVEVARIPVKEIFAPTPSADAR
jgi:Uma2 family endonuclease